MRFLLLLLAGLFSCNQGEKNVNNSTEKDGALYYIKIDVPDFSFLEPLRLSEIVDSISYVQLETTSDCLLSDYGVSNICRVDSFLFLSGKFNIYQFDAISGAFFRHIGRMGQGPGEYLQVDEAIDKDNKIIYVKSPGNPKLLSYNYEGKYLGNLYLTDTEDFSFSTCFYSLNLIGIDSQSMIFLSELVPLEQACHPYELIIYDYKNKKIRYSLKNLMNGKCNGYSYLRNGLRVVYKQNNHFFYKAFYNDTLYSVHEEKGISPYAIIDFGKRKYSTDALFEQRMSTEMNGKILINGMFVNSNFVLLQCYMIDNDKSGGAEWFTCKYDIHKDELTYHSSYLLNDIDGSVNVSISDLSNKIVSVIPFDEIEEGKEKKVLSMLDKSKLKYPELKEKFNQMQNNRNSDDNPLLMMLHLKND